jgi:hypothetical protein
MTPKIRQENPMRRWLILAAFLLSTCSGCGAMEDFILGPDPYLAEQAALPPSSCNAPPPNVSVSQTQEPPLLQTTR